MAGGLCCIVLVLVIMSYILCYYWVVDGLFMFLVLLMLGLFRCYLLVVCWVWFYCCGWGFCCCCFDVVVLVVFCVLCFFGV